MAEENKIILDVSITGLESIDELNKQLADARKAYKNAQAGSSEYNQASLKINEVNAKLNEHKGYLKQVENQSKANSNTIEGLRAEYKRLSAEAIRTDIGSEKFKQLQTNAKIVSDQLKELEKGMGNTSRNVGNYSQGFKEALGNLGGGFGKAITGIQGFNTALSANPIGAVVSLINMLVNALKGNAEVADFVERAMAGLNKTFQLVVDTIVSFGQSLGKAFSNPKQAILDLITLIKDNLLNRFKAFGVIARGIADGDLKAVGNGFLQLSTGVEDVIGKVQKAGKALTTAGQEGFNAAKKLDEFTVSQANLNREMKLNEKQMAALERDLKNVGLTLERRKKIATELADLEIRNAKIAQTAAKEILDIEREKLKGKTLNGEEEAKLIDLQTAYELAKEDEKIAAAQRSKRIALLLKKEEVEAKKALNNEEVKNEEKKLEELRKGQEEYNKYLEDQAKKEAKAAEQLVQYKKELQIEDAKTLEEKLQLELELAQQKFDADLEANDYTKSELALREAKYLEEIADLNDKYAEDAAQKKEKDNKEDLDRKQRNAANTLQILQNVSSISSQLGEEAKGIQKAAGITSAIISTYQGAAAALQPPPVGAGPLLGPILAASTIGLGLANIAQIAAAAGGGDFVTTKPTLLLVGDNPGGRERVTVEPLSGKGQTRVHPNSGLIAMAGGGSLTVNNAMASVSGTASNQVFDQMALGKTFSDAMANMGRPVVSVVDIKKVTKKTDVTEQKARLRR